MNYIYCPRILYFERVLHIPQATTIKEYKGRESHQRFNKNSKRAAMAEEFRGYKKEYEIWVEDSEIGFRTIIDCIIVNPNNNSAYIVQAKDSFAPKQVYRTQKFQLFAEMYLAKKCLGLNIQGAYVDYLKDNKMVEIKVGEKSCSEFLTALKSMHKIIETEKMPAPTEYPKKCQDCCYYTICKRI